MVDSPSSETGSADAQLSTLLRTTRRLPSWMHQVYGGDHPEAPAPTRSFFVVFGHQRSGHVVTGSISASLLISVTSLTIITNHCPAPDEETKENPGATRTS